MKRIPQSPPTQVNLALTSACPKDECEDEGDEDSTGGQNQDDAGLVLQSLEHCSTQERKSAGKEPCGQPEGGPALSEAHGMKIGSPARTRTSNLAVTSAPAFRSGLDYIITPKGVGRFAPLRRAERATAFRPSLCTFPATRSRRASLRVLLPLSRVRLP